ncbi:hypothetical protein [Pseudomonas monteilii]|uniref:hypothetical protein n=1 Tax=Pseudomonas monteilii TaxID=76759 RepID=UPI001E3A10D6|nr:hypothetical protein [Pseudomonas monteilii]MCE1009751.1 hypothetical protein [Pseudomonas monteilii]
MNKHVSPKALSLEDYLKEMEKQRWTFGWGAILVFDRQKTNVLLMQEYIDRLGTDQQFPVFEDSEEDVGEGVKHVLMGLTLDRPRLSFENASIQHGRVAATMRMVGGKQLQLKESVLAGETHKVVTRLSTLNAIVGPSLIFTADLATSQSSIGDEGAVVLKLIQLNENGEFIYQYKFTGVETEFERIRLGTHLAELMKTWGDELTTLPLSELRESEDSVLEPARFGIRTHAEHNSAKRGDPAFGEGAVVLFIAMKGDKNGSYPHEDKDMLYMLPSSAEKFTSNLILAQDLIYNKVIFPEINKVPWVADAKFEDREIPGSRHRELVATAGGWWARINHEVPLFRCLTPAFGFNYADEPAMRFRVERNGVVFKLNPDPVFVDGVVGHREHTANPWPDRKFTLKTTVDVEVVFSFKVKVEGENSVIDFSVQSQRSNTAIELVYADPKVTPNQIQFIYDYLKFYRQGLQAYATSLAASLVDIGATLDAFRLNNLLFKGGNVVMPVNLNMPTDLTVLGHLSPQRTDLVIEPSEVVVAGGGSLTFKASGASDIKWSVDNVDGEEGEKGDIDLSGKYTAPSADSLRASGFRRVIVTATAGDKVSKAMLSLVESSVSVYPSVVVVSLGSKYSLVAGEVDKKALTWTLKDQNLGAIEEDPDKDPTMQDGRKFVAAKTLPAPGAGEPLNFISSRLAEVEVSSADNSKRTIDVLVVVDQSGSYWLEAEVSGTGVQLTFYRTTRSVPKEKVPAAATHWHKYKGDGTFENGLYTPKAGSAEQYAIVTAFYDDGDSVDRFAYMIIPVPFVSSQRFVQLLGTEKVN